jgi:hypothetical protein
MTSIPAEAAIHVFLLVVGLIFFFLPFTRRGATFPKWIRLGLLVMGLSFVGGSLLGAWAGVVPRGEPELASCLREYRATLLGIGAGAFLLLLLSGELVKASAQSKRGDV